MGSKTRPKADKKMISTRNFEPILTGERIVRGVAIAEASVWVGNNFGLISSPELQFLVCLDYLDRLS